MNSSTGDSSDTHVIAGQLRIPVAEFAFQFSRSSGPGGQNVNKVNTRVQLRWNIDQSPSLPEEIRARLHTRARRRINNEGDLLITSQRYRDQHRNRQDCVERLQVILEEVQHTPTPRKPTRPTRGSKDRRIQGKKQKSEKKQRRRPPRLDS